MHSEKILLAKLVSYLDRDSECFIIQGEGLDITLLDVYFFTGFPLLGMIGETSPNLPRGVSMDDLCSRNCYASAYVHNSYILLCKTKSLET